MALPTYTGNNKSILGNLRILSMRIKLTLILRKANISHLTTLLIKERAAFSIPTTTQNKSLVKAKLQECTIKLTYLQTN